ncbi:MAG: GNAT family N-acetyltransferase [Bryobacteraceae bacterium]
MGDEQKEPEVILNQAAHRFEIRHGDDLAVLEYRLRGGNHLVLTHTGVPPRLAGKGVGALLVRTALEHAREHHLRLVPLCSFVQAYLRRHPEYGDLVDTDKR